MMEDMGLPFPGPDFFELLPAYQTLLPDTWFFSFPKHSNIWNIGKNCFCCGLPPSAPHRGARPHRCTPIYFDFQTRADIRIRIRRIVIRIRIRHTAIRVRVVVPAIDHTAYWVALPAAKLLNICAKLVRILRNAPKQHGNEATEHRASPIYPVPRAAV